MSTEYQIKEKTLNIFFDFIEDSKMFMEDGEAVIKFILPFGFETHVTKVIYNDLGNGRMVFRSKLTPEDNWEEYCPEILVVKERGFRNRREEIECFLDYSSRYDGEYEDMDGNFVTSKEELEFREKTLKEINKFWDGFESIYWE